MRSILFVFLCSILAVQAATDGLDAVLARRKTMRKLERRVVAQRMEDGNILSVYDDDTISTSAVRVVTMPQTTKDKVEELIADTDTLKAAKALAKTLKLKHPDKVSKLTDAEIVAASETVLDTSAKDGATGAAIGLAFGAAAVAAGKKKEPKKEEPKEKEPKTKGKS